MGRALHDSLELALGEKIETLDLPMPEIVPAYQVTVKLNIEEDDSGDISTINTVTTIESIIRPIKNVNSGPNNVTLSTNSHASLADRSADRQHPSTAIWNNPTATSVEQAITDLYTHIYNTYSLGQLRYTNWTDQVVVNQTGLWVALNGIDAEQYRDAYDYVLKNYPDAFVDADTYANPIAMTSNTAPEPYVVTTSSQNGTTTAGWRAFDKNNTGYWASNSGNFSGGYGNEWIQFQIPEPTKLVQLNLRTGSLGAGYIPDVFVLSGSNDGVTFDDLLIVNGSGMSSASTWYNFPIPTMANSYSYYRITIAKVRSTAASYVILSEIQFVKERLLLKDIKDAVGNTAYMKVA
jgi:hypothetical protein